MNGSDIAIVIAAAGTGSRFGSRLPKQFCLLRGLPVVFHSIRRFKAILPQSQIVAVIADGMHDYWTELCRRFDFGPIETVTGGSTRWQSVKNALEHIEPSRKQVLVHDAARPLVDDAVVRELILSVTSGHHNGALPVMPMTDSVRQLTPQGSVATDRSRLVAVQTPQAFDLAALRHAYSLPYNPAMTDDASVMEAAGFSDIALCAGAEATFKVTRPHDLAVAELYLD